MSDLLAPVDLALLREPEVPEALLAAACGPNKSFSRDLPGLQIAVDSTSLGAFKECPRKYFYSVILGLQSRRPSPHLFFGTVLHKARETYEHARADGASHADALRTALAEALRASWDKRLARPWISEDTYKNRRTLIMTIVAYLDEVAKDDNLQTVLLTSGQPAVELSFTFPASIASQETGEELVFCGHLDRIVSLNDDLYVSDIKTTKSDLSPRHFSQWSPDNQFSLYTAAGLVAFGTPVKGMIVDAIQILVNGSRHGRALISRTTAQVEEWLVGARWWLRQMESAAAARHWPQNDKSCGLYGGCSFRSICAKPPGARATWLQSEFGSRKWDPLERRGKVEAE